MITPLCPIDLHTEYRREPLGIDVVTPRLGWGLQGGGRDAVQSAWQVQVGSAVGSADFWDSGRVVGDAQIAIGYAGATLKSRTRYFWRVRVWDGVGCEGPWSDSSWFETAFLDPAEFAGTWLSARAQGDDERITLAAARWVRPVLNTAVVPELICYGLRIELPAGVGVVRALLHVFADGHEAPWSCGVGHHLSVNRVRPDSS